MSAAGLGRDALGGRRRPLGWAHVSATAPGVGAERGGGASADLPGLPEGLFVTEQAPAAGWGEGTGTVVVLVHGSLDRATSFRRVVRRLDGMGVVIYDRRGYQRSRDAPVSDDLAVHVDDLVRIATSVAEHRAGPGGVVAVGHSAGGTIVLGAAVRTPALFRAVGAYEPTMPWLGFHGPSSPGALADQGTDADPGLEAERFFRRIVGDGAWEQLSEGQRAGLRADGPALLADMRAILKSAPFDVTRLAVPAIVACGGPSSSPRHLDTADWLAAHVEAVRRSTIAAAGHGAHLSHPNEFADFVREVAGTRAVERARTSRLERWRGHEQWPTGPPTR